MTETPRPMLLIASANPGKVAEFRALLPESIESLSLGDVSVALPEETGETFADNARVKALVAARQSGLIALGDDSGLEVDALDGAPGIYSARFAGGHGDAAANRAKLLGLMAEVPDAQRSARFRCVVVVASPEGIIAEADGVCEGSIARVEAGEHGFGYDSIVTLGDRTIAQLDPVEKNRVSHRAKALRNVLPALMAHVGLIKDAETCLESSADQR